SRLSLLFSVRLEFVGRANPRPTRPPEIGSKISLRILVELLGSMLNIVNISSELVILFPSRLSEDVKELAPLDCEDEALGIRSQVKGSAVCLEKGEGWNGISER